jgi:hypothetical protein
MVLVMVVGAVVALVLGVALVLVQVLVFGVILPVDVALGLLFWVPEVNVVIVVGMIPDVPLAMSYLTVAAI